MITSKMYLEITVTQNHTAKMSLVDRAEAEAKFEKILKELRDLTDEIGNCNSYVEVSGMTKEHDS